MRAFHLENWEIDHIQDMRKLDSHTQTIITGAVHERAVVSEAVHDPDTPQQRSKVLRFRTGSR